MDGTSQTHNPGDFLTATQAVEAFPQLGVSSQTLRRWARDGLLPAVRLPSGRMRFRREDLAQLLQSDCTAQSVEAAS